MVHAGWSDKDYEVVGIVADARLSALGDAPSEAFYLAAAQVGTPEMRILVRTSGDPERMIGPLRRVLKRNDGSVLFSEPVTMDSILDKSLAGYRSIVSVGERVLRDCTGADPSSDCTACWPTT